MEEALSKMAFAIDRVNGEPSLPDAKGEKPMNNARSPTVDCETIVPFPIAIVGMGMRLPGGVKNGEEFWEFLVNKRDGLCPVPETRYNIDGFYHESREGCIRTKHAYFLQDDIAQLDTTFFGMSKLEAGKLDPQQRMLLKVVWECMENAGQTDWQGSDIGFFVGSFGEDWLDLQAKDTQFHDRYRVMSGGDFALSNRISYEYDLRGPSVTVRTGCSASMVGLHEACQALYSGECSSALVAGTMLVMSPTMSISQSDNMVISPSGICRTFDAAADGYGRGEAINVIYIKPLREALEDGDPVRAIIRASAVNCDGRTPSITTPGSEAQERLIRRAYQRAGIDTEEVEKTAFFECHGTGTIVGDTAETSVVANIFGKEGIYIGAVKPNVGHSEGASGVTSIIKCVLALEHDTIPPNVHFRDPSPKIPFESARLQVPLEPTPWPANRSKRVSVNSFGIGGTNAHVILESASEVHRKQVTMGGKQKEDDARLLLVSARSKQGLNGQVDGILKYLEDRAFSMDDLAYTLGRRRSHLPHRAFAVVGEGEDTPTFEKSEAKKSEIIFVFTGQGSQWPTMGRELLARSTQFRDSIREMDRVLGSLINPPSWSIEEELDKSEEVSRVADTEFAQPLCTAVQVGLTNMLRHWGITPQSVVGHSSGEIAAAFAAGAISARLAIILSYFRGQAAKEVSKRHSGTMAAVALSPGQPKPYLQEGVIIACNNSPQSVTLSGDVKVLEDILSRIEADNKDIFHRKLAINVAYHSHHMEEARQTYETFITPYMTCNSSMIPLFSSVLESEITDPASLDASYWGQNLRLPVLFNAAINLALDKDDSMPKLLLEVGPHSALAGPVRQIIHAQAETKPAALYVPTLRRESAQWVSMLQAAGQLYMHGAAVELHSIIPEGKVLTNLPPYAWQHEDRFWSQPRMVQDWRLRKEPHHELLGSRTLESTDIEPSWRNMLTLNETAWLSDHCLGGDIIFPCAGYVAMVGEAIRQTTGSADYSIKNLFMSTALLLEPRNTMEIITQLRPTKISDNVDSVWYDFTICAYHETTWKKHCIGQVRPGSDKQYDELSLDTYSREVQSKRWYTALEKRGLEYGSQFRRLEKITASPSEYRAAATISDEDSFYVSYYALHPILVDQCLQLLSVAATHGIPRRMTRLCIPLAIESLYIRPGRGTMALDVLCNSDGGNLCGGATLVSEGHVVLSLHRGIFFSIQDPDRGKQRMPITATLHWDPDVEFLPFDCQIPQYRNLVVDGAKLSLTAHLFVIETYHRTKSLDTKADHLHKWLTRIRAEYTAMANHDPELLPESRQAYELSEDERKSKLEQMKETSQTDGLWPAYRLFERIHETVEDLLDEKIKPIDLLMQDDGLKSFYEVPSAETRWGNYLSLLGHSDPTLRVLEVGGGTGGDTVVALRGLTSPEGNWLYSKYTFSDISAVFLGDAKERFKSYGNMEYKTLDISRDPIEQGYQEDSYDLVIASNVVHATPKISETLDHIKRLLTPRGRLLLLELCDRSHMIDYIMGILPGWWLGEADGRADRPYIPVDRWNRELLDAGFTGVDAFRYDNPEPYQLNAHMISRVSHTQPKERGEVYLLYRFNISEWGRDLAREMSLAGYDVRWHPMDQPPPSGRNFISLVDLEGPFFHNMSERDFLAFQACITAMDNVRILWVTHPIQAACPDPRYGLGLGMVRNIRCEITPYVATMELHTIDQSTLGPVMQVFEKLVFFNVENRKPPEYEFAFKDGTIQVPRFHWSSIDEMTRASTGIQGPRRLDIDTYAMLDSLVWTCSGLDDQALGDEEVEVEIKYVGINFRDMMILMGFMASPAELGVEASGIILRVGPSVTSLSVGDRVMLAGAGLACTRKIVPASNCQPVPDDLSLEDASTVICVYATVIYSLMKLADLKKDQSVLIHSACGGVGLAAIQICQMIGAEIYATVGNEDKIQHLMSTFGIPRDHIFDSRSASFLHGILHMTNGVGVDVVLNSLSGELLHASWKCVAPYGKMLELGKRDFLGHGKLEMDVFAENRMFVGVDLFNILKERSDILRQMSEDIMGYFDEGKAGPIKPVHVYDALEAEKAFRYMQTGQHMGKIVIKMPDDPSSLPLSRMHEAAPYFSSHVSYLMVGGLGGLGRAVATWMAERGAKHLIFLSPGGAESSARQAFLEELKCQGCECIAISGSVANINDVMGAISATAKPVAGVIQLSMLLRDKGLATMTYEDWTTALEPKVQGTWNLHHALQNVPLEFFVLVSSIAGIYGWPGQANTFLDAFVKYRHSKGMVASVIDLGLMADIGYVSESARSETFELARSNSLQMLEEGQFLQGLEAAIFSHKFRIPNQIVVGLGTTSLNPKSDSIGKLTKDSRFSIWMNLLSDRDRAPSSPKGDQLRAYMEQVKNNPELLDDPETEAKMVKELGKLIASYTSSSDEMTQEEYANIVIDSLMTFEIRTWFRGHANIEISLAEVSNAGTVGGLAKVALKKLREKYRPAQEGEGVEPEQLEEQGEEDSFREDIALGRTIQPISGPATVWTADTEGQVFLTGATGFVGVFFLEHLLRLPQVKAISCLIRANDEPAGLARLRKAFQKYSVTVPSKLETKIIIVPGDTTKECFGLGKESFDRLAQLTSVIFHFAAYAHYLMPYSLHRNANVLSQLEVLRFANSGRLKPIHYCSSISASGLPKHQLTELAEDARPLLESHEFHESIGYTRSKFVGEKIMWNAIDNGFPVAIYRPSVITGHSVTGACREEDMINRLYTNCLRAGAYPRPPDQMTHFVPVDFVCAAILNISLKSDSIGHAFNVIHPDQSQLVTVADTFDMLNRYCPTPMRCVSGAEWIEQYSEVKDLQVKVKAQLVTPELSSRTLLWDNWSCPATYSTENLRRALADKPEVLYLKPIPELLKVYYLHWSGNT
ncbi:hypothetical protein FE257_001300 [Aspergillus nanangensis]|uniref:Carrier domain-containing protein n=1 Tax=Aspergillus nanangensis TaxID=2582783 RepID=A0AAD4CEE6_ASPNN|nr:hypothetical protein FE257_001300 [Aspergillus nanangensis]